MEQQIKELWVGALRSGAYSQGMGLLRARKGGESYYCCLGVLCDLHAKMHNTQWKEDTQDVFTYLGADVALPKPVLAWAGIDVVNPAVILRGDFVGGWTALTRLNDEAVPFPVIASIIEAKL